MAVPTDMKQCTICNIEVEERFCTRCGQKVTGKRVNLIDLFAALFNGLFSLERGIFGNLKMLVLKPEFVAQNYWKGNRKYYFSPGQMIFYALFVIGLHVTFVDPYFLGIDIVIEGVEGSLKALLTPQVFFFLGTLPLYALITFATFFKWNRNFLEHVIADAYSFSISIILSILISDVLHILADVDLGFGIVLFLLTLYVWSTRIFIPHKRFGFKLLLFLVQLFMFFACITLLVWLFVEPERVNINW